MEISVVSHLSINFVSEIKREINERVLAEAHQEYGGVNERRL